MPAKVYPETVGSGAMLDGHTQHPRGPSSHPHSWKMDHLPPPQKEVSQGLQGLQWDLVGPAPEAGVMQGRLEGVCLGALQGEPGPKSSAQCKGAPRNHQQRKAYKESRPSTKPMVMWLRSERTAVQQQDPTHPVWQPDSPALLYLQLLLIFLCLSLGRCLRLLRVSIPVPVSVYVAVSVGEFAADSRFSAAAVRR